MKVRIAVILPMILLLLSSGFFGGIISAARATTPADLYIDGQPTPYKQLKYKNRMENMIPLRTVTSQLKMKLTWVKKNSEWTLSGDFHRITMKLNDLTATVDGKVYKLNAPPLIEKGTIYLPLRFTVTMSGGELHWDRDHIYWVLSPLQKALNSAIIGNDVEYVRQHLTNWRSAALPLGVDGTMPYLFSVQSLDMVKLLIEKGFPVDYMKNEYASLTFNNWQRTLLQEAASLGQFEVVAYLLNQGAGPFLSNSHHYNALDYAQWGKQQLQENALWIELSIELGKDITEENYNKTIDLLKAHMEQISG
ncbi:stalk domain-containing protein [Cohnella luojiensis]|nr:stalk domain-containing protein [Cohnella luojiensis]